MLMKTLIVGMGVIGTIYGWALSEAGVDITHIVRKGKKAKFEKGIAVDVYDLREGYPESQNTRYQSKIIEEVSPEDGFELIIVATKQYQAAEAVRELKDIIPLASFLMFTANWEGPEEIDKLLPRSQYLWGYAASTGGYSGDLLVANIAKGFHLGELDGTRTKRLETIIEMFNKAHIKADLKSNIIEWLWIHYAISAGLIGTALYAGGLEEMFSNPDVERLMVPAVQDALRVLEKRGVDITQYPDTEPFLKQPPEITTKNYRHTFIETTWGKRALDTGHFKNNPEEMQQFYFEVLETGEKLGVSMPYLSSFKSKILASSSEPG
jgi:2-dehydropantoate 2-reductase